MMLNDSDKEQKNRWIACSDDDGIHSRGDYDTLQYTRVLGRIAGRSTVKSHVLQSPGP